MDKKICLPSSLLLTPDDPDVDDDDGKRERGRMKEKEAAGK